MPPRSPVALRAAPVSRRGGSASTSGLSAIEDEFVGYFVPWGEVLGVPKSVAQIYGLLFAAVEPLDFETIRTKLGVSKGSVSQGLKFLRDRELVTVERGAEARRERYAAVPSLGRFVQAQLKGEVAPRLNEGADRLERMRALAGDDEERAARVERLSGWNRRGRELLPMLLNLMGG